MAMMSSITDKPSSGGGSYSYYVRSVERVKRKIADVKADIRAKDKTNWYLFFLTHEDLEEHPETLISVELASKLGLLTGDAGFLFAPIKQGLDSFKKDLLGFNFLPQHKKYIQETRDASIIIHEFPLALYNHYPEEFVKPTLILKFPNFERNINNYLEIFSCITYLINNKLNVIDNLKKLFGTNSSIIDCSKEMRFSIRNKFVNSYREKFMEVAQKITQTIQAEGLIRDFKSQIFTGAPANSKLTLFAAGLMPIEDANVRDKKLKSNRNLRLLKVIVGGIVAIITFLGALAEFTGINLVDLIKNYF